MSQSAQHTPGPWELHANRYPNGELHGRPYIYAPNGPDCWRHICEPFIDDKSGPPEIQSLQEANARLIAAAPEMLKALEMAHGVIYEALNRRGGKLALSHALIDICNVLAKAKGDA